MVEMETTVICDKNDILLVKSFTDNEDEKFTITFDCPYDESANILKIMEKCKFYQLLFKLNGDLVSDFNYEKNSLGNGGCGVFYFKEKYEGEYICMAFDDVITKHSPNHVSIDGKDNNYDNFKEGFKKFDASDMHCDIKLIEGRIHLCFCIIITSDDLVNDIIAMMVKKQMFRLKKYVEKE